MKATKLSHTVLYAKGWYRVSEDIYYDLRATLKADGYSTVLFSDEDILRVMLNRMEECEFDSYSLSDFIVNTKPQGEFTREVMMLTYILDKFRWIGDYCWEKATPDYNEVLPLPESKTLEVVREFFPKKDIK
jgi:hypothetical protein